jgi:hypothetical protein
MSQSIGAMIKQLSGDANRQEQPCDILFGTVVEPEPALKILTDGQLLLEGAMLILSRGVTDFKTWLSFDNPSIKQKIKIYDRAEKESEDEPLPAAVKEGGEPHAPRPDDLPEPVVERETDIQFARKWYDNTLRLKDENGDIPEKAELPAFHEVTIYSCLKPGERVILVKQRGGQKYFVMDRIGEDNTDTNIP